MPHQRRHGDGVEGQPDLGARLEKVYEENIAFAVDRGTVVEVEGRHERA